MRECGMLLPIASLPSKYGIGCFSKEAYEFVDQLKEGGQSFWQILPLGPTGFGDSPYQAFSAFAGNSTKNVPKSQIVYNQCIVETSFPTVVKKIDNGVKLFDSKQGRKGGKDFRIKREGRIWNLSGKTKECKFQNSFAFAVGKYFCYICAVEGGQTRGGQEVNGFLQGGKTLPVVDYNP